jgi:putative ABC transport system substrate-binding protein
MKRRDLVLLLGGAMVLARTPRAQQKPMPVIGFLNGGSADKSAAFFTAFRNELAAMGYVEGQTISVEYRHADGHYDRLSGFAADLVQRNVLAIAAVSLPAVLAAKAATTTIPIVFVTGANPVTEGLVASFNRPGGNLTGISMMSPTMVTKQIEMLREIVPKAELMGVLVNPTNRIHESQLADMQAGALVQKIQLSVVRASTEQEIEAAFAGLSQQRASAAIIPGDTFFFDRLVQIVALEARYVLPTVYESPEFPTAGGLMNYGASFLSAFGDLATYTGRILKGAKPEDLPVAQTTKFEMVINLKTAQALGLTIPQSVLARADKIIE